MTACQTCQLIARRDRGEAPLWDRIARTDCWDVVHANNTSLPGWIVVVARRHIEAVDELTPEEAAELGEWLRLVSGALRAVTGCVKTYVMQFAEHPAHPHVHFHVVPRMADQPEQYRSAGIFGYLGVPDDQKLGDAQMNEIAQAIRRHLSIPDAGS